jgi:hypothetical protein
LDDSLQKSKLRLVLIVGVSNSLIDGKHDFSDADVRNLVYNVTITIANERKEYQDTTTMRSWIIKPCTHSWTHLVVSVAVDIVPYLKHPFVGFVGTQCLSVLYECFSFFF